MCARFVVSLPDLAELVTEFGVAELRSTGWTPRFNIAPTQLAPVITNERARALTQMRFGLVPGWAKSPAIASRLINARSETAAQRGAFRGALAQRRCVIPVSGYYEWKKVGSRKQPLFVHARAQGRVIPLSGVWERWTSPDGEVLETFAILTRAAEGFLRDVHDRMPLEVPAEALDLWLDPNPKTAEELAPVLQSVRGAEALTAHPVSTLVNSVANDSPSCIEQAAELPPDRQLDLFGAAPEIARKTKRPRSRQGERR